MLNRRQFLGTIAAGAVLVPSGARALPLAEPGGFAFLTVGDWGKNTDAQRAVAAAMGEEAGQAAARFVVSTGDNFYDAGIRGFDDPLWRTVFEDVYTAPSLQIPWYPVLGNHDRRGNAMAEVAYSSRSARWRMPAPFYRVREGIVDGWDADFFFLDTQPIYHETSRVARALDGDDDDEQMAWLAQELAASTARWKIVVGHHSIFSGGRHGGAPELQRALLPLLERHGVHAYLSGHNHCLEHIVVNGIHHLTSGAGARTYECTPVDGSRFAGGKTGFLTARVTADAIDLQFVGADGAHIYAATLPHPGSHS